MADATTVFNILETKYRDFDEVERLDCSKISRTEYVQSSSLASLKEACPKRFSVWRSSHPSL
jgi:hypothetical protein